MVLAGVHAQRRTESLGVRPSAPTEGKTKRDLTLGTSPPRGPCPAETPVRKRLPSLISLHQSYFEEILSLSRGKKKSAFPSRRTSCALLSNTDAAHRLQHRERREMGTNRHPNSWRISLLVGVAPTAVGGAEAPGKISLTQEERKTSLRKG